MGSYRQQYDEDHTNLYPKNILVCLKIGYTTKTVTSTGKMMIDHDKPLDVRRQFTKVNFGILQQFVCRPNQAFSGESVTWRIGVFEYVFNGC